MPPRRKPKKRAAVADDLLFITDLPLRRKIEDALETTSFLYLQEKGGGMSEGFSRENRRMIILYSASIIEAVLLHLYKRKGFSISRVVYKKVHVLPQTYQLDLDTKLVLAKQIEEPRDDRELMLDTLLKHFVSEGVIKLPLKKKIDKAKNVRNTFHLSKSRKGIQCSAPSVESSFTAVLGTIISVRDYLRLNP